MVSPEELDQEESEEVIGKADATLQVLLVEDGYVNQRVAVGLLERMGHHVQVAENGQVAVKLWRENGFDVILMDWQMPVMDGKEATRAIRAEEQATGGHTPIFAMTAAAMKGDREQCLEAGMDDYISKPIDPSALAQMLSQVSPAATPLPMPPSTEQMHADVSQEDENDILPSGPEKENREAGQWTMIDLEHAKSRMGDCDEVLLAEITGILLKEIPMRLREIDKALADGDSIGVTRGAHTLKGAAGMFRADCFVEAAWKIEELGKKKKLEPVPTVLNQPKQHASKLEDELRQFLASVAPD